VNPLCFGCKSKRSSAEKYALNFYYRPLRFFCALVTL